MEKESRRLAVGVDRGRPTQKLVASQYRFPGFPDDRGLGKTVMTLRTENPFPERVGYTPHFVAFKLCPVADSATSATSAGVPVATTNPPFSPPVGPRSIR